MAEVKVREMAGGERPIIRKFENLEEFKRWMSQRKQATEMEVSEA